MFPQNTWVFDLEIINAIHDKKGSTLPNPKYRYCRGWTDYDGMGVSVLVAAHLFTPAIRVFVAPDALSLNETYEPLVHFQQIIDDCEMLVGHNSVGFDANVLNANKLVIPQEKHYDFYHEIKQSLGTAFPRGYNLDALSRRVGGAGKSGDGAAAPFLWQDGKKQEVIDYCVNDIILTKLVAEYFHVNGHLPQPTMAPLALRRPVRSPAHG